MTLSLFSLDELVLFFFLTVRIGAIVLALPFLGSRTFPAQAKIVFIFLLSFGLYPIVQAKGFVVPQTTGHLGLLILGELATGMTIGFVVQILFAGIQLAGELMGHQMGLNLSSIFDPQNGQQSSLIAHFQYVLALLLFFSLHAHHWFIYAMAESLHRVPLLGFTFQKMVVASFITLLGNMFIMAIKIGAPVIVVLLLSTLAMGIVARLVPQMNIFILSFPLSLSIGLIVLGFSLPYILQELQTLFGQLGQQLFLVIRLIGTG